MEYCWHLGRKKMGELYSLKNIYTRCKVLTPAQTATKLVVNEKTKIEWDIFKTMEWIMDEINWCVIDNNLKDQLRGPHDQGCLDVERDKRRDRPDKLVMCLKEILP
jgi:hypothetical protein